MSKDKQRVQIDLDPNVARALTHHKRRGFQDLVAIFLDYGLRAYRRGELEVTLTEKVVDYQIMAKGASLKD
jgi:hypothetical protein